MCARQKVRQEKGEFSRAPISCRSWRARIVPAATATCTVTALFTLLLYLRTRRCDRLLETRPARLVWALECSPRIGSKDGVQISVRPEEMAAFAKEW